MPSFEELQKEYGDHHYNRGDGTGDCACGCYMGSSNSSGPLGLDPFGTCPQNPKDGKLLGGDLDYKVVVTQRINNLESRVSKAETALGKVQPSKKKLARALDIVRQKLHIAEQKLSQIGDLLKRKD